MIGIARIVLGNGPFGRNASKERWKPRERRISEGVAVIAADRRQKNRRQN